MLALLAALLLAPLLALHAAEPTLNNRSRMMRMMRNALRLLVASFSLLLPTIGNAEGRNFQSLDGAWQIVFDRNTEGGARQWVREKHFPREQMREIAVPSFWELIEMDYEGVAYYRRPFNAGYHYLGTAKIMAPIGKAFPEANSQVLKSIQSK